jgi:hypothetical protein
MRSFLVAAALSAAAPVAVAAPSVIVLEVPATSQHAWPSGERAVVAELLASDVELVLRASNAPSLAELEQEVLKAATEPSASVARGSRVLRSWRLIRVVRRCASRTTFAKELSRKGPSRSG